MNLAIILQLNLYIWAQYLAYNALKDFLHANNCIVEMSTWIFNQWQLMKQVIFPLITDQYNTYMFSYHEEKYFDAFSCIQWENARRKRFFPIFFRYLCSFIGVVILEESISHPTRLTNWTNFRLTQLTKKNVYQEKHRVLLEIKISKKRTWVVVLPTGWQPTRALPV